MPSSRASEGHAKLSTVLPEITLCVLIIRENSVSPYLESSLSQSFSTSRLSAITFYPKLLNHTEEKERKATKKLHISTYRHAQAKGTSVRVDVDMSEPIEKEIFEQAQQYTNAATQILE